MPAGRPTIRTPDNRERILDAVRLGLAEATACKLAGISENALTDWKRDDAEFSVDLARAVGEGMQKYAKRLDQRALDGDTGAIQFFLARRCPEFRQEKGDDKATPTEVGVAVAAALAAMKASDGLGGGPPE